MPKNEQVKEQVEEPVVLQEKDEMHIDDFLNHMESVGHREALAAFSLFSKAKGWVKKESQEWEDEFKKFMDSEPQ